MRGNSPVTGEFPTQRPVMRSFDVFFDLCLIYAWINGWVNNGEAGDLRCHHTHYDITVMSTSQWLCTLIKFQNILCKNVQIHPVIYDIFLSSLSQYLYFLGWFPRGLAVVAVVVIDHNLSSNILHKKSIRLNTWTLLQKPINHAEWCPLNGLILFRCNVLPSW